MGGWEEGVWRWKLCWRRSWFEWDNVLLTNFMQELESATIARDTCDRWVWDGSSNHGFTVKHAYEALVVPSLVDLPNISNFIWQSNVPSKVNVLAWRILLDRIPVAYKIWSSCYNWVGLSFVFSNKPCLHLQQHFGCLKGNRRKKMWLVIWFAIIWNIWITRNKKIFQDEEIHVEKVVENVMFSS